MKKLICLLLAAVLVLGTAACGKIQGNSSLLPESTGGEENSMPESDGLQQGGNGGAVQAGVQAFATATASQLVDAAKNSCYSPVSLYLALSLATAGADGTTRDELLNVLNAKDAAALNNAAAALMLALPYKEDGGEGRRLELANSVWLNKLAASGFNSSYEKLAKDYYKASLFNEPFGKPATDKKANKWIMDNTGGQINAGYKTDADMYMVLMNTVYYADNWLDKFQKENNTTDNFALADGSSTKCEYMNQTLTEHKYYEGDGFTASYIGLSGGGRMTFVLPNEGVAPKELLTSAKAAEWMDITGWKNADVVFQVPKFKFEDDLSPKKALEALGVACAFDPQSASFPLLSEGSDPPLYIGNIIQKTTIDLNETGVEAAAVTILEMAATAAPMEELEEVEFFLTRPFIFVLTSGCNINDVYGQVPLFVGVVQVPEYGS